MKTILSLDCPELAGLSPRSDSSRNLLSCPPCNKGYGKVPEFYNIHLLVLGFSLNCPNSSLTPLCLHPSPFLLLSLSPPPPSSSLSPLSSMLLGWAGIHTGRSLMPELGLGPIFQNPGARSLVFPKFQACIETFHTIA